VAEKCIGNYTGLSGQSTPQADHRLKTIEKFSQEECSSLGGYFKYVLLWNLLN